MTIELAPEQADYHYHLGNFLFLFEDDLAREDFGEGFGKGVHAQVLQTGGQTFSLEFRLSIEIRTKLL